MYDVGLLVPLAGLENKNSLCGWKIITLLIKPTQSCSPFAPSYFIAFLLLLDTWIGCVKKVHSVINSPVVPRGHSQQQQQQQQQQ